MLANDSDLLRRLHGYLLIDKGKGKYIQNLKEKLCRSLWNSLLISNGMLCLLILLGNQFPSSNGGFLRFLQYMAGKQMHKDLRINVYIS